MANEDSTPGIWQNDMWGIVLAHVIGYVWSTMEGDQTSSGSEDVYCLRVLTVCDVVVDLDAYRSPDVTSRAEAKVKNHEIAKSFIQALNMYWESRSHDARLR